MPTTRSQKNANNIAAETLMSIHNDNGILQDMLIQDTRSVSCEKHKDQHELDKAKEELCKLKLIATETLMSIHKDNDIIQDMITISYQEQEHKRAKEELAKLKLIKEHTSNYNTLKMLVDIHTREMDRLELIISTLLSSVDK